jgi:hypothetical protein
MTVVRPQELIEQVLGQREGVCINLSETEEAVERSIGLLEWAETKD